MTGIPHGISHGGALDRAIAKYGGRREVWLDLSTGINPNPYPLPEIPAEAWQRLPDRAAEEKLITAARKAYRVPERMEIVLAPGTQALIQALPRILPGKTATILTTPNGTYGEHAHCCEAAARHVREALSPDDIAADESLTVTVNPNNPDGHVWRHEALANLAARLAERDGHLVIDEAFCDVAPEASVIADGPANSIVLRSFGKFFGLAGLRLGFAICSPDIASRLRAWFGPWAASGPALEIGAFALDDTNWAEHTRNRLENDSENLSKLLEKNGFSLVGRTGLFVLMRHERAPGITDDLARRHILVRAFDDRPGLLRFGLCAGEAERARLDAALGQLM